MDKGTFCILYLIILLAFLLRFYKKRCKKSKVGIVIISIYIISSISSFIYYKIANGLFYDYNNITFKPFLLWLVVFCVTLLPLYKYDKTHFGHIQSPNLILKCFLYFKIGRASCRERV